ncbi:MAG TPA: SRPBCC domain-containing protein [Candidatus Lustribacter sp.]|nr:SRPBCC domain-containing protein [Candidatus Lustribacter sp.]
MTDTAQSEVAAEIDSSVVHVSTVVPHPLDHVWRVINSPQGVQTLLGAGAKLGGKGEPWRAEDGSHGVLRSYHPLEQIRVSWHPDGDGPVSLVDLHVVSEQGQTRVDLRHEHLTKAGLDIQVLATRWTEALERLSVLTSG